MKSLIIGALLLLGTLQAPAQGTVLFNNRVPGTLVTRVYINYNSDDSFSVRGNGTDDTPSGTHDWTGYVGLTGSGWMAAIRSGVGAGLSESQLTFGANPTTTTFRSGLNAGGFVGTTATLNNIPPDTAAATLEIFVWNFATSGITDPATAYAAWYSGPNFLAGFSGAFTVTNIGGPLNATPNLIGLQSFGIITYIPEPGVLALLSVGMAAWLGSHRRNR
jgi:hypothetical protein